MDWCITPLQVRVGSNVVISVTANWQSLEIRGKAGRGGGRVVKP